MKHASSPKIPHHGEAEARREGKTKGYMFRIHNAGVRKRLIDGTASCKALRFAKKSKKVPTIPRNNPIA
jgi:hypothetical protein